MQHPSDIFVVMPLSCGLCARHFPWHSNLHHYLPACLSVPLDPEILEGRHHFFFHYRQTLAECLVDSGCLYGLCASTEGNSEGAF